MTHEQKPFTHIPVLLEEVLHCFEPVAAQGQTMRFLDGTLGLGGHTSALLERFPSCQVLGLDRDQEALALARERLASYQERFLSLHCRFSRFAEGLAQVGWQEIDGALIDIGVSSLQLDEDIRGFSVYGDGPLDMRMDASMGESAWHLVNRADFTKLRDIIATYGEDPQAGRIARAICDARQKSAIATTTQLAEIVRNAYPPAWRAKARHHPATRTFQALRMVVNDELGELEAFLQGILNVLRPGGRLCVITFHSLEDRMVKQSMRTWAQHCICPPYQAVCTCQHTPQVQIITKKPLAASKDELARNPRASSAKLRCCEKC